MNKQTNPNHQTLLQFMLRAQHLARQDARSDRGSAMLIASIVTILLFSMLGAFMTMTNLNKSATNAYIDGNNTFYAAESGLNRRASQIRDNFVGYDTPNGTSPLTSTTSLTTAMSSCFPVSTTTSVTANDFECRNYPFRYNNNAETATDRDGNIVLSDVDNNSKSVNYVAYTFVADKTNYATSGTTTLTYPTPTEIPNDQAYGGLSAQEYKYTIYATAAKPDPLNSTQPVRNSQAKTVLQMDFKSRIVPLFQFGVFYDGDLDISSHSDMNVYGRVHTNKTLIITPESSALLTIAGAKSGETNDQLNYRITAAGDIYTKDDVNGGASGTLRIVVPSSSVTTTPITSTATLAAPDSRAINYKSLAIGKTTPMNDSGTAPANYKLSNFAPYISNYLSPTPVRVLNPPGLGFLRKIDNDGKITDYYGKADLRLTMQYDRAVPFDLTSIQTGTGAKGSTCPDTGTGNMNIPTDRQERSSAKCTAFSKGVLNSLQQPVLVMTKDNTEEQTRFCEQANLNKITGIITPASALNGFSPTTKDKILRALQVAIASSPTPITYENVTTTGVLPSGVQTTFRNLLDRLKTTDATLSTLNTTTASVLPPATIAAIRSSCFLPAPIQKLVNPTTGTMKFYDRREQRAMKYLQTNIESLTVWNRDGVYVDFGTSLTTAASDFTTTDITTKINAAFDDVITATPTTYSADGLLFVRDTAVSTATTGSFQKLGLAAKDLTEGGLVFHATLDDTTYPIDTGDKKRIYDSAAADKGKYKSPFGFIFNDGANLPGPMTIASDQAIYTQGNYNNFGYVDTSNIGAKQPAALLADTVTALSNACVKTTAADANTVTIPLGQVNCLINQTKQAATTTDLFAAYAARSDVTCGNLGSHAPTAYCTDRRTRKNGSNTGTYFGGGLQNFMRMLEDWTPSAGRQTFRYRGSMVNLGIPEEFNGLIVFGDVFEIPNRDFGFDPAFNAFDKLPPLSPRAIYLQQEVFKRTYNN